VIIPDLLGHGKTKDVSGITLEDWNKQILNILNFYSVNKVTIVGVSMGGVIAQNFAVNYENKINQLILSDTFCELETMKEKIMRYIKINGYNVYKLPKSNMLSKEMASTKKADIAYPIKKYFSSSQRILNSQKMITARKAINKADPKEKLNALNVPS